jgi:ADP-heptose:LPS heptosyltransferase
MTTSQTPPVGTILVYSKGELIGDALAKLPFLRALRGTWPLAHISWINPGDCLFAGPALQPLVAPYLNETISHTGVDSCVRNLFSRPLPHRRFDLVIDTHRHVLNTLILRRVRHRMFISGAAYFLLSDRRPPAHPYRKSGTLIERLFDLIRAASGREPCLAAAPSLPSRFETAARAAIPEGATYVGLVPGAGSRYKCWPRERYEALANHCLSRGLRPVFILGPDERDWIQPLRAIVPDALFPLQAFARCRKSPPTSIEPATIADAVDHGLLISL